MAEYVFTVEASVHGTEFGPGDRVPTAVVRNSKQRKWLVESGAAKRVESKRKDDGG